MNPVAQIVEKAQAIAASLDGCGGGEFVWERASDQELLAAVQSLSGLSRLVDAALAGAAGQVAARSNPEDETSLARQQGERSATVLLGKLTGTSTGDAFRAAAVGVATGPRRSLTGEPLPSAHPHVAAALASGALSIDAAHAILRCLGKVAQVLTGDDLLDLEQQLVDTVAVWRLSVEDLLRFLKTVPEHLDPDSTEPRTTALHGRRTAWKRQLDNGLTRFLFDLDPEGAAFLSAALDARTAQSRGITWRNGDEGGDDDTEPIDPASDAAVKDDRTSGQRLADAIVLIAEQALTVDDGDLAGAPVTVVVTGTIDQLTDALGPVALAGVDQPADAGTLRRLAVDAGIIPQILGGASEVLDQGCTRRLFTTAQRRALASRDKGCVWPGCTAPPSWCQAAHTQPWNRGGPTDLNNGMLLCWYHHRRYDNDGWTMHRDPTGIPWFIPPAHVDASRRPRAGGRPPLPMVA